MKVKLKRISNKKQLFMNQFNTEEQLKNEYRYFFALSKDKKVEYLNEFVMPDNLRRIVEFDKISESSLVAVFNEISSYNEQKQSA